MTTEITTWKDALAGAHDRFLSIAKETGTEMSYQAEAVFASMAVSKNDYLLKAAMANPASLRSAVINIASIGLSLNPATKLAFLIPRDNEVCLDISYVGLIKLATDTGSIRWAKAELVYKNDDFQYKGMNTDPHHDANVFGDRGELVGTYCVAKTSDGDMLVEVMTMADINKVKESAKGTQSKYSPWTNFPGEMIKKTVIKRASKTWPKSARTVRLDTAIDVINRHEGLDEKYLEHETIGTEPVDHMKVEALAQTVREIIDDDIEEDDRTDKLKEIDDALSPDEQIAISKMLRLTKATGTNRHYGGIYKTYLNPNRLDGEG